MEAADEASISRMYGDIHYRRSVAAGVEQREKWVNTLLKNRGWCHPDHYCYFIGTKNYRTNAVNPLN